MWQEKTVVRSEYRAEVMCRTSCGSRLRAGFVLRRILDAASGRAEFEVRVGA